MRLTLLLLLTACEPGQTFWFRGGECSDHLDGVVKIVGDGEPLYQCQFVEGKYQWVYWRPAYGRNR